MTALPPLADPECPRSDPGPGPSAGSHGELGVEPAEDPFARTVSAPNRQLSTASAAGVHDRVFDRVEVIPPTVLVAEETALIEAGRPGQNADVDTTREVNT